MKKRKQKALKYLGLSIVCFGLHACSIFLEPFAVNSENKMAAGGYILGVLFWVTLLAGAVLFGACREIISKTSGYQEWKQKKVIYYLIIGKESSQNCNTIKNFMFFPVMRIMIIIRKIFLN